MKGRVMFGMHNRVCNIPRGLGANVIYLAFASYLNRPILIPDLEANRMLTLASRDQAISSIRAERSFDSLFPMVVRK